MANKETKQITKKITNNVGYIEKEWNNLANRMSFEKDSNKYIALRFAFFCGAMVMFEKVIEIGKDNSMDVGEVKLESIAQELEDYKAEIKAIAEQGK